MRLDGCTEGVISGNWLYQNIRVVGNAQDVLISGNKAASITIRDVTNAFAANVRATVIGNKAYSIIVNNSTRVHVLDNEANWISAVNGADHTVLKGNISPTTSGDGLYIEDSDDCLVIDNDVWGYGFGSADSVVHIAGTSARTRVERNRYHGKAPSQVGTEYNHGVRISATAGDTIVGWNDWNRNLAAGPEIENLGSAAIEWLDVQEVDFIHYPDAEVLTGPIRKYFATDVEIIDVFIVADDGPTGADMIANIHKDGSGTGMFTTAPNKPTVDDGSNEGSTTVPDDTTVAAGSYLKVKFEQVGSTTPGGAVTILVRYRRQF